MTVSFEGRGLHDREREMGEGNSVPISRQQRHEVFVSSFGHAGERTVKSVDLPGSQAPTVRPSLPPGLRPAAASPRRPRLAPGSPPPATSRTPSNLLYKTKQQPHTCVCTPAATHTQGELRSKALSHVSFSSFQPPHPVTTPSPGCPTVRNKKRGSDSRSGASLARSLGYSQH